MVIIDAIWNAFMKQWKKPIYGRNVKIVGRLFLHGVKRGIVIGEGSIITSSDFYNPTDGVSHSHLVAGREGALRIGRKVGMSNVRISALQKVVIKDNVMIGAGVRIWDSDFHPVAYHDRINGKQAIPKPVLIEEGVFIGASSIILKGVTIGRRSVIGAGSVVTKNIPSNEVWAGNPARFIKKIEQEM